MGSGLILLVIVGAWLAVLVPMALRSHDASTSLSTVDRFSDAMRVLSRRDRTGPGREVLVPRREVAEEAPPGEPKAGPTLAQRRRRVLLTLVAVAVVSLVAALLVTPLLFALHALADLLAVAYVVHLRRQALLQAERRRRQRRRELAADIPDRMPPRPAPLGQPLPARATRYDEPVPRTTRTTWDPVPVPVPAYVTAPPAPRVTLDLTRPGAWSEQLLDEDAGLDVLDDGPELDEILDRRRAVGGW